MITAKDEDQVVGNGTPLSQRRDRSLDSRGPGDQMSVLQDRAPSRSRDRVELGQRPRRAASYVVSESEDSGDEVESFSDEEWSSQDDTRGGRWVKDAVVTPKLPTFNGDKASKASPFTSNLSSSVVIIGGQIVSS